MAGRRGRLTRGERNIRWIERYCVIPEGRDVGKPVRLRDWQREILLSIYDSPTRRAIVSFGRKNAKTTLSAFVLLLHLCGPEARQNAQLYSAAQSRDQAALLFDLAAKIVRMSPTLHAVTQIRDSRKELLCPELGTKYRALSADHSTAYGLSPSLVVHDELGQVEEETSALYDALETAAGAQEQPLSIVISTQAPDERFLLSRLIRDAGEDGSGEQKVFLWTAPMDMDPFSEEAIKAANPAYGDFLNAEEVRRQADSAKRIGGAAESRFRNLILNQRISVKPGLFAATTWDECEMQLELSSFSGQECWAGLDLSATTDTTALSLVLRHERGFWAKTLFWLPADGLEDKARTDHVPYDVWARAGHLLTCPGRAIDQLAVLEHVARLVAEHGLLLRGIAFDRWGMNFLRPQIERAGLELPLVEFGQGFQSMSPALATMESLVLNGKFRHCGSPILRNHVANAVVVQDDAGNRKLTKRRAIGRIDGLIALVMALHTASGAVEEDPEFQFFTV